MKTKIVGALILACMSMVTSGCAVGTGLVTGVGDIFTGGEMSKLVHEATKEKFDKHAFLAGTIETRVTPEGLLEMRLKELIPGGPVSAKNPGDQGVLRRGGVYYVARYNPNNMVAALDMDKYLTAITYGKFRKDIFNVPVERAKNSNPKTGGLPDILGINRDNTYSIKGRTWALDPDDAAVIHHDVLAFKLNQGLASKTLAIYVKNKQLIDSLLEGNLNNLESVIKIMDYDNLVKDFSGVRVNEDLASEYGSRRNKNSVQLAFDELSDNQKGGKDIPGIPLITDDEITNISRMIEFSIMSVMDPVYSIANSQIPRDSVFRELKNNRDTSAVFKDKNTTVKWLLSDSSLSFLSEKENSDKAKRKGLLDKAMLKAECVDKLIQIGFTTSKSEGACNKIAEQKRKNPSFDMEAFYRDAEQLMKGQGN